ncbi:MAG TPA: carboxylesterase family protein, partial [Pseudomonadales bacterium]|nr:carboxylesterase family protein [Pseudomonadales bacterium]
LAFASGEAFDVPLIIGSNSYEASLMQAFGIPPQRMLARMTPVLRAAYAGDATSDAALAQALFTDSVMGAPAHWIASEAAGGAPAWLYHFSYVASFRQGRVPGAAHGSEISYAFGTGSSVLARFPMLSLSDEDESMEHLMHSCWVGFAKTGRPACDGATWPAFEPGRDELFEFGMHPGVRAHFRETQYKALEATMSGKD